VALQRPPSPDDPWWLRALEPLRSEAAMFRVLLVVAAVCGVIIAVTLLARAVF
jgi:hypothetical protein